MCVFASTVPRYIFTSGDIPTNIITVSECVKRMYKALIGIKTTRNLPLFIELEIRFKEKTKPTEIRVFVGNVNHRLTLNTLVKP